VNNCWAEKTFTANVNICEGLEELQLQSKLLLFPNPANARINFKLESPAIQNKQNLNVILFDAYGNLMDEKRIQANTTEAFELANYPEGLYIISLFQDNQRISAKKITIERNQ
ncbi:MAG: T9SS type A sorting domain-containing protein, partial [Bacteroidota bacterium]